MTLFERVEPLRVRLGWDEVHVWRVRLDYGRAVVQTARAILSADEVARADRFKFDEHRDRFTIARAALRRLLGAYLGIEPAAIQFHTTRHGKPFVKHLLHGEELCFNLSHSHDMALVGFTIRRRIGVDIEHLRRIVDMESIARHFFAEPEVESLFNLPQPLRHTAFLHCWTRKEAYIKAIGEGLSHPLDQFCVNLVPGEPPRLLSNERDPDAVHRWRYADIDADPDYLGSLIVESAGGQVAEWRLSCYHLDMNG